MTRPMAPIRIGLAAVLAVGLGAAAPAGSAPEALSQAQRQQILQEAQEAYEQGLALRRNDQIKARKEFATAARRFGQLADDGIVNGMLEYNLANAWFQAGDLGRAIAHYRQAQDLLPNDARIDHNLEYARSLRRSRIAASGTRALGDALLGWHARIPLQARVYTGLTAWVLLWVALGLLVAVPRPAWRWVAVAAAGVSIACGASVAGQLAGERAHVQGVVIADDVVVRKGNSEGFEPQFAEPLHQGVEFEVLERRPGWFLIRLPNDRTGWIHENDAVLITRAAQTR